MMRDHLDEQFAGYLSRDDDALLGSQFFETLAEIERRRAQETAGAPHPVHPACEADQTGDGHT